MSLKRIVIAGREKGTPDDEVSPFFGRCGAFCVVDLLEGDVESSSVVSNEAVDLPGRAGFFAADSVVNLGADAVVAGDFGTASTQVFHRSGVKQYIIKESTIKEALDKMLSGKGQCVDCESIISSNRFGMGMGTGMRRKMSAGTKAGSGFFVCRRCGCRMPKKSDEDRISCPNCGFIME